MHNWLTFTSIFSSQALRIYTLIATHFRGPRMEWLLVPPPKTKSQNVASDQFCPTALRVGSMLLLQNVDSIQQKRLKKFLLNKKYQIFAARYLDLKSMLNQNVAIPGCSCCISGSISGNLHAKYCCLGPIHWHELLDRTGYAGLGMAGQSLSYFIVFQKCLVEPGIVC